MHISLKFKMPRLRDSRFLNLEAPSPRSQGPRKQNLDPDMPLRPKTPASPQLQPPPQKKNKKTVSFKLQTQTPNPQHRTPRPKRANACMERLEPHNSIKPPIRSPRSPLHSHRYWGHGLEVGAAAQGQKVPVLVPWSRPWCLCFVGFGV